jgi:hypothetical protein
VYNLLQTTVLALGLAYVGFDLYFFAATFGWMRRLRRVNRNVLVFSGFREMLEFVFRGPVPGVVQDLTRTANSTDQAARLVAQTYPELRDRFEVAQSQVDLPHQLMQLEKEAANLRWLSAALAVVVSLLVVFAGALPYGFEVLIGVVLGNSILMIPFASTRVGVDTTLRRSEEVVARARNSGTAPVPAPTPEAMDPR